MKFWRSEVRRDMTIEERNALVEQYLPYIRRLTNKLLRAGQRPTITRADLFSVGCHSLIRDLERQPEIPLPHLMRHARTFMIRFIHAERSHWNNRKPWSEMFDEDGREKF